MHYTTERWLHCLTRRCVVIADRERFDICPVGKIKYTKILNTKLCIFLKIWKPCTRIQRKINKREKCCAPFVVYQTQEFTTTIIIIITTAQQWTLSWVCSNQFLSSQSITQRCFLVLSPYIWLGLPSGLLPESGINIGKKVIKFWNFAHEFVNSVWKHIKTVRLYEVGFCCHTEKWSPKHALQTVFSANSSLATDHMAKTYINEIVWKQIIYAFSVEASVMEQLNNLER